MPIFNKARASCLNFAPVGYIIFFFILDSKQNYLLLCNKTFLSVPWLFAIQISLKRDSCIKLITASACKMCRNPRDLRVFSPSVWKPEESFGCELILKRGFELFSAQPTYLVFYLPFSLLVNILIFFFPGKNLCQQSFWRKLKLWDAN